MRSEAELSEALQQLPEEERPEASSQASVNRYERGVRSPPISFVLALARLGEVNPKWLLLGEGHPSDGINEDLSRLRLDFVEAVLRSPLPADILELHFRNFDTAARAWRSRKSDGGDAVLGPEERAAAGRSPRKDTGSTEGRDSA